MAIHAAMITRMDREIGRVVEQLRTMNQLDNTVILFLSDNGASAEQIIRGDGHAASAAPGSAHRIYVWARAGRARRILLSDSHKSYVNEGGIASPLIAHWPAGIKEKGGLRHDPCHFIDVLPTLVNLAGGNAARRQPAVPSLAGKSLVPAFAKSGTVAREYLYFNHSNNRAIRMGDWKLVATGQSGPWELYDLSKDRAEQRNLITAQPDRAKRMSELWQERDTNFVKTREAARPTAKPALQRPSW